MDEVERVKLKKEPPDLDAWNNQMYKIRLFDQLVYDSDHRKTAQYFRSLRSLLPCWTVNR